ncbi:unnamed protein product [Musa textilis]
MEVPNLQVIELMQSFKSREYVRETFAWQRYYWYLADDGIEYLRKKVFWLMFSFLCRGPPRFEGDRPRFLGIEMDIGVVLVLEVLRVILVTRAAHLRSFGHLSGYASTHFSYLYSKLFFLSSKFATRIMR